MRVSPDGAFRREHRMRKLDAGAPLSLGTAPKRLRRRAMTGAVVGERAVTGWCRANYFLIASTSTPAPTIAMPVHSRSDGRS